MASIAQTIESDVLAAVVVASNADQAQIEAFFASGEAAAQNALAGLLKKIPTVRGLAGIAVGPLETALESGIDAYVAQLVAKETPATLFGLWIALLERLQADVAAG